MNTQETQSPGSLQPDCCAAAWKRLALTLAEESQAVLDNAHWEVSFGSGDLRRTIKAVRELQRSESTKPHNVQAQRLAEKTKRMNNTTNLQTETPRPVRCSAWLGQFNFAWCIMYLRNGGERLRAIMLARDGLGITLAEAREWVDTVKLNRKLVSMEANRKLHAEYPGGISEEELRDHLEYEVSHWPNSADQRPGHTGGLDCK